MNSAWDMRNEKVLELFRDMQIVNGDIINITDAIKREYNKWMPNKAKINALELKKQHQEQVLLDIKKEYEYVRLNLPLGFFRGVYNKKKSPARKKKSPMLKRKSPPRKKSPRSGENRDIKYSCCN